MKTHSIVLILAGVALATTAASAQNGATRVNGVTISQQRVDFFVRNVVAQGSPDTPELRAMVKEELINRELLTQEATRRGINKDPDVALQIDMARQEVLMSALLRDVLKSSAVPEDTIRKEYERLKNTREYKARHILVQKEEEAKEIIAQIKKGASFEKLAAEKSLDQGTRSKGGDLDWGVAAGYVKPFGDALAKLKKGQMTEMPVQSKHGWHVIRLEDERPAKIPPYEAVKQNLQQQLVQQAHKQTFDKTLADLKAKAKIENP